MDQSVKKVIVVSLVVLLGIFACLIAVSAQQQINARIPVSRTEYLIYLVEEYPKPQRLIFYNMALGSHTQILNDREIKDFVVSVNNRLAFLSPYNGKNEVYVLDYPFNENKPVKISAYPASNFVELSWSPNGHYLLFDEVQGDRKKLVVWDGKAIQDIYENYQYIGEVTWNSDNHLAFTDFSLHGGDPSEIFIWDRKSIFSVTQNPTGNDRYPAWSKNGELAFLSEQNGKNDVFIWDGFTMYDGVPDSSTFVNVAPDLTDYYSIPTWTNINTLSFTGIGAWELGAQVYEWNGQVATNISKNPLEENGGQTWRSDGYWSFVTYFSDTEELYVRDERNRTILKINGQYPPAWSSTGMLLFCRNNHLGWTIAIWDGVDIIEIVQGDNVIAKWQSGAGVYCSHG